MSDHRDDSSYPLLEAAVECAPSGLLMVDGEGRIALVNREVERLFGYPREELLGQPVEMLVPEHARGRHPADRTSFYRAPVARPMGHGRDLAGRRKDGTTFPVEIGLTPVNTASGMYVLGVVVDISTRKQAEAVRHRLEAELRQAQKMEAIGLLAGGVAHDFNNVLGAIVGYAELVGDRVRDDAESTEDLRRLLRATQHGKEIVERILRFTRRQSADRSVLDLDGPVNETVQLLRSSLPGSVSFRVDVAPDTPPVVANATAVHQILLNLGTNASQAMHGAGELVILLAPFYARDSVVRHTPELQEGHYAMLEVRDTGQGMPPEVLARVFEPFYTTKAAGQGTGLGLPMVHSLMRDHGGAVAIESEEGVGTTVRCYFPALATANVAPTASPTTAPTEQNSIRGHGERVFFVDDQAALADVGMRRLAALGYTARAFTEPTAALSAVACDPDAIDVLITDHSMPGMNGLELARAVRQIRPDLPVIMLTGWTEDLAAVHVSAAGVNRLLVKPVSSEELGLALRQALDIRP